jgi:phage tail-like protein
VRISVRGWSWKMSTQDYLIELDGKLAGRFFSFTGGTAETDVVTTMGAGGKQGKHIANVRYQDIVMKCGTGMSQAFYDWVGGISGAVQRKHGAIMKIDKAGNILGRLEFVDAVVNSLTTPALKSGANDEAFLTVSIAPEYTSFKKGSGKAELGVYVSDQSAKWSVGGFNFGIAGVSSRTTDQINSIGSLTIGRKIAHEFVGDRPAHKVAATSFPNVTVSIPELHADEFFDWFEKFVQQGNISDERNGYINFLGPNGGKEYFSLSCRNMGIVQLKTETPLRTGSQAPVKIELYSEQITFSAGSPAIK